MHYYSILNDKYKKIKFDQIRDHAPLKMYFAFCNELCLNEFSI